MDFLAEPEAVKKRFHIPLLEGVMSHVPGKLLHVTPELFFQLEGVNRIEFPGERYNLHAGYACLIPGGLPHSEVFVPIRGSFRMLVFMFDGGNIDFHVCEMSGQEKSREERQERIETNEGARIAAVLDDLARLAQSSDKMTVCARWHLAAGIINWLGIALKSKSTRPAYSPKISQALHLVMKHLENQELGTAMLAKLIGCSPDYLSFLFHKETGVQLVRHIQYERVNKAQYLLLNSAMTIKEIASACGFTSPDYFGRMFHHITGQMPSRYRSRNRR